MTVCNFEPRTPRSHFKFSSHTTCVRRKETLPLVIILSFMIVMKNRFYFFQFYQNIAKLQPRYFRSFTNKKVLIFSNLCHLLVSERRWIFFSWIFVCMTFQTYFIWQKTFKTYIRKMLTSAFLFKPVYSCYQRFSDASLS